MRRTFIVGFAVFCALAQSYVSAQTVADSGGVVIDDTINPPQDDMQSLPSPIYRPNDWDETATRTYYNSSLRLMWNRQMGDHEVGSLGHALVKQAVAPSPVVIPVTGNNFLITCGTGAGTRFASREIADTSKRPLLTVNGSQTYLATRDTFLSSTTEQPLGREAALSCTNTVLVAFDGYTPKFGDKAQLTLTPIKTFGNQAISVYEPSIGPAPLNIPFSKATRIVAEFLPSDFRKNKYLTIGSDAVSGTVTPAHLAAISHMFKIPTSKEYYLTVVMKVGVDWPACCGKFPGLTNTGAVGAHPAIVDGVDCSNAGWGGRRANGCRWSARTGWGSRQGDLFGANTYYYALKTGDGWGKAISMASPWRVGTWFAYVERVRLNDVGQANGMLSYWRCSEQGCAEQFHKADILWRTTDIKQSEISEVWADVYCGGRSCPSAPIGGSTASIKSLTVTDGLPDLSKVQAELASLNPAS